MSKLFRVTDVTDNDSGYEDIACDPYDLSDDYSPKFNPSALQMPNFDFDSLQASPTLDYLSKNDYNRISDVDLKRFSDEHFHNSYMQFSMHNKSAFFLLQSELFLSTRNYKEALSAALVSESLIGETLAIKAIKMICMYQLNDDKRFKDLKEEILASSLEGLSDTLRQHTIGTIQVASLVPEFLSCLESMKSKQTC
ncbi:hypothetical protein BEWA_020190 [Theileria equi strain WA]|uniref:Uncharacterized protein n=1 Tax=Theileria equi strain WA TaxID=1537102 RepID=L0AV97_THEEQ|nr:hypothetical protein BEWA_020190 [Theileria equi strain WA]AFZ79173.1 hypothetical protein BEWA_020190 [Theileria equi strain WA]|eukprot:XP_004828839.1 hypothetical protein BEWA_020190 [Theileria equi strain WA]